MTGCGFKNNLFKSLLEKYYFIAHGGDFAGCLLLFTRRYCVCLRKGTGAGRSCCLSYCQAGRNGAAFLRPFTVLRKRFPAPFSCSTLLPGPSLRSPAYSMTPDWVIFTVGFISTVKSL